MKQTRDRPTATITKKAQRSITKGHPWVYGAEVLQLTEQPQNGTLVDVVSEKGSYLGTGFFSLHSKIRIRLISRNANDTFDDGFWHRRLTHAWDYRKTVMGDVDIRCSRIIFGEADYFPGLTADLYNDILVTQTLSMGMEQMKPMLFPMLFELLTNEGVPLKGIYERNDVAIRELEGLEQYKGWYPLFGIDTPSTAATDIIENGITYHVDIENGQKTGFFLDQKYNRAAVAKLAKGKRVLDCFTHTGSFALNAAKGGASHVTAVDSSALAIEMAEEHACLNGAQSIMTCVEQNVFDLLPTLKKGSYEFIILDPPAFTKNRKTINNALKGYQEINTRAMRLLPRGGYLATCSCSHFISAEAFIDMLARSAREANVSLRQIEERQQSPDHPILHGVPETNYLKFFLFQVT